MPCIGHLGFSLLKVLELPKPMGSEKENSWGERGAGIDRAI